MRRISGWTVLITTLMASAAAGQSGQPLFVLDLQGTALDEFPSALKALNGTMTVVDRNGQHMLRASSPSEFLITLPQVLPADFTVEVDLIPKSCCNPEDFMLEGTPSRNRGAASAELTWHPAHIMAVGGGGEMYQSDMPADLAASTPGNLTQLVIEFRGTTIKLYTNGRRLYTLDKQFARGRVLRVWLGGQDENLNAVSLAGLRILPGAVASGLIALAPSTLPNVNQSGGQQTSSQQQASTGGTLPTVVSNVSVMQGAAGPVVNWLPVSVPAAYSVRRWKIDDVICCNHASPPTPTLTGPPWQDAPLPVAGTYVYEVTATMSGGVAIGQTQFINLVAGGNQIASIATPTPAPSPAPTLPAPSSLPTLAPPSPATPTISAPIAAAPRTGGTSSLVAGPATLTATPIGWGVELRWPEVVGGATYQVESSLAGQTFAALQTIDARYQPPQAGTFSVAVQNMLPGSTTLYRVRAVLSDGTATPYSPLARHDAPSQVPYVSNLTTLQVFRGPLSANGPIGYRGIRWGWAEVTGAVSYLTQYAIQIDIFSRDPSGALIPVPGGSMRTASVRNLYEDDFAVASGNAVRFCVSVVFAPSATLQFAVCQMTAIP